MSVDNSKLYEVLKKYWGYDAFRSPQKEIVLSVCKGVDTLALLPTGGGKSLCYQLPAVLFNGLTLVISPLIALMEDQVNSLKKKGIKAEALHSGLSARQVDILLDNCIYGDVKLLYVAPERLQSHMFQERIAKMDISLIAVDEAHCISQWGYDFRPNYLKIGEFRTDFKNVPLIALTATASSIVVKDIEDKLKLASPIVYSKSFFRANLSIRILPTKNKIKRVKEAVQKHKGESGLIYVRNRRMAVEIARELRRFCTADHYHAGLKFAERSEKQRKWIDNEIQVIVATNAFGMGIDKEDVRFVIHYDLPPSIEEYYQEIGRAGRDAKESNAYLFYQEMDQMRLKENHQKSFPTINYLKEVYDKVFRFLKIPVGEGREQLREFNFYNFYKSYDLDRIEAYNAISQLEKEGYFTLSSGFKTKNSVKIIADRNRILNAIGNEKRILQYLLRQYEGITLEYSKIDEERMARELALTKDKIIKELQKFSRLKLLDYRNSTGSPKLFFHYERLPIGNVSIDKKNYLLRKNQQGVRIESISNLLKTKTCKQLTILEYFDEKRETKCGKCDVCLLEWYYSEFTEREIEKSVEKYIYSKSRIKLEELLSFFEFYQRSRIVDVLKRMEENEVLRISKDHYLSST